MGRSQASNRIHDQKCVVAVFAHQLRYSLHIMACARRAFGSLQVDGTRFRPQFVAYLIQLKGVAVWFFDQVNATAESFGEITPAFAEFSSSEHQHLIAGRS